MIVNNSFTEINKTCTIFFCLQVLRQKTLQTTQTCI